MRAISAECLHTLGEASAVCHPTHMWRLSQTYAGTETSESRWFSVWTLIFLACFFTLTRVFHTFRAGAHLPSRRSTCTRSSENMFAYRLHVRPAKQSKADIGLVRCLTEHTGSQPSLAWSCSDTHKIRLKQASAVFVLRVCSWRYAALKAPICVR